MHNNYRITTTNGKTKQVIALSEEHAKDVLKKKHPKLAVKKLEKINNSLSI